ncbi:hypothetical protein [Pseudochrobactrum sp. XF203]|uniref:hypothetical protein n=1 Tax=Pseudochrobactrum sp. XF203 TaxID=2879116 RepID=UPI001CE2E9FF|nr:hypothetical protein [Pseudochrobactrum sp. XF203]UCA45385.1 hypothetical protein LDL70_13875 [Pseudochrobactrum sp. XF203]
MLIWSALNGPEDILSFYPEIRIIGRTRFSTVEDMKESISPNFAIRSTSHSNQCLAFNQHTFWSGVANGFSQDGAAESAHICRRLSTQIIKSTRRLEKLSLSYRSALPSQKIPEDGSVSFQQDKFASNIGNEFGSFLDDLYGLRDAINVIVYKILLGKEGSFSTSALKKAVAACELSPTVDLINAAMFDDVDGDLIISKMSTYRGVALHSMGTSNPVTLDSLMIKSVSGPLGKIARLVYPLYDDITQLKEIEAGKSFRLIHNRDEFERFAKLDNHLDGMEFAYDCFVRLLQIAESLGIELRLEPRHIQLTDRDILKATFTDDNGNVVHLERDPISGALKERIESHFQLSAIVNFHQDYRVWNSYFAGYNQRLLVA